MPDLLLFAELFAIFGCCFKQPNLPPMADSLLAPMPAAAPIFFGFGCFCLKLTKPSTSIAGVFLHHLLLQHFYLFCGLHSLLKS